MKFKSLYFEHFRQFIGKTTIRFATDQNKNTTVILGQNGNGKTGIFRAIIFSLYGTKRLPQDPSNTAIELVNWQQLKEAEGQTVIATVSLEFEHLGNDYTLTRRVAARLEKGQYIEMPIPKDSTIKEVELSYMEYGECKNIKDVDEIQRQIKRILPQEMSEFFFFDGEQRSSILGDGDLSKREQRNMIKKEIYRMLQIEPLEDARKLLQTLIQRKKKEVERCATNHELKEKTKKEAIYTQQLEDLKQRIDSLKEEKEQAQYELHDKQQILDQNSKAEYIQQQLKDKQAVINERLNHKAELLKRTKTNITQMSQLLVYPLLQTEQSTLRDLLSNEESRIALDVLQDSVLNHQCELCHQDLSHEVERKLLQMIEQYKTKASTDIMQRIIYDMDHFDRQQDTIHQKIEDDFQIFANIDEKIEQAQQEKQFVKDEFDQLHFDAHELNKIRERVSSLPLKIERYQQEIQNITIQIHDLEQVQLPTLKKEIQELSLQDNKVVKIRAILNKLETLYQILNDMITDYRQTVIIELSKEMTTLYQQLINEKDREKLDHIEVTDQFDVLFINSFGHNSRSDNSQGQNQMLSLSFVLALAQYAAKGRDELNFPLLIDTPFGRLDKGNRRNLIEHIPQLTDQWILLVTDTELSNNELNYFVENQRVGANYQLINDVHGTRVEEKESTTQLLKGE